MTDRLFETVTTWKKHRRNAVGAKYLTWWRESERNVFGRAFVSGASTPILSDWAQCGRWILLISIGRAGNARSLRWTRYEPFLPGNNSAARGQNLSKIVTRTFDKFLSFRGSTSTRSVVGINNPILSRNIQFLERILGKRWNVFV